MNLSFLFTLQVVYFKKKGDNKAVSSAVQDLVLAETVEVTIPVLYTICFMLAYFGPNAQVIGNI